jgi:CMP-N-acetylneuraminic acid synthetase
MGVKIILSFKLTLQIPLLSVKTINSAIKQHIDNNVDYFAVTKLHERLYDKNVNPINHEINKLIQTQDLEPFYHETLDFMFFLKIILGKIIIEFHLIRSSMKHIFLRILI